MTEFFDFLKKRRSIRDFEDKQAPLEIFYYNPGHIYRDEENHVEALSLVLRLRS